MRGTALFETSSSLWQRQGVLRKDGVLALAYSLVTLLVPTLSTVGAQIGDLPQRPVGILGTGLVLAQTLPLTLRRRNPALCLILVACAFAAHQALGFATTFASLGLYLALFSAGAHQARRRPLLAGVLTAGYAALAIGLEGLGSPQLVADYVAFYLFLAAFWIVGSMMRARRTQEVRRRRLASELATAAERARIARELHDVVTHHVTAMVIQADAAQCVLASAPGKAAEGLTAVSATGRQALTELRHLLGVLEATGDGATGHPEQAQRAPALGRIQDLVEQARRSGQPVAFLQQGAPHDHDQPVDVELTAYRIVQEALTNALKHAPGSPTSVTVTLGDKHLEVEVITTEPCPPSAAVPPAPVAEAGLAGGRGLAGLHARVQLVDGHLHAGPRLDGGFEVRAVIPSMPTQE
ncbi:histidine kinase [Streptomyces sp. NPDC048111]|uniref:histidine kinase n=1 Tax=Streptomyces sp. NPDC048111 TaxID=3365500 RepID=UPI003713CB29